MVAEGLEGDHTAARRAKQVAVLRQVGYNIRRVWRAAVFGLARRMLAYECR
jgi:hypothetical protein